ncbi:MAG: hypothetical protein ACQEP1_04150 [Nanobdellota archaeon]
MRAGKIIVGLSLVIMLMLSLSVLVAGQEYGDSTDPELDKENNDDGGCDDPSKKCFHGNEEETDGEDETEDDGVGVEQYATLDDINLNPNEKNVQKKQEKELRKFKKQFDEKVDVDSKEMSQEEKELANQYYDRDTSFWTSIFPSASEKAIGDFIDKATGINAAFNNWVGGSEFGRKLTEWVTSPSAKVVEKAFCYEQTEKLRNNYKDYYSSRFTGGPGGWPSPDGSTMMYAYGRRKEYADENGKALMDWDNDHKWFPDADGKPKGYLYKFSWNVHHPYTSGEIESLSNSQLDDKGLLDDGSLQYNIVLTTQGGEDDWFVSDKIRNVSPGDNDANTVSFYNKKKYTGIYIRFGNGFELDGNARYPPGQNEKCPEYGSTTEDTEDDLDKNIYFNSRHFQYDPEDSYMDQGCVIPYPVSVSQMGGTYSANKEGDKDDDTAGTPVNSGTEGDGESGGGEDDPPV